MCYYLNIACFCFLSHFFSGIERRHAPAFAISKWIFCLNNWSCVLNQRRKLQSKLERNRKKNALFANNFFLLLLCYYVVVLWKSMLAWHAEYIDTEKRLSFCFFSLLFFCHSISAYLSLPLFSTHAYVVVKYPHSFK